MNDRVLSRIAFATDRTTPSSSRFHPVGLAQESTSRPRNSFGMMARRISAYLCIWLALVLLYADPRGPRYAFAALAVAAGVCMRLTWAQSGRWLGSAIAAGAAIVTLAASLQSVAGLGRILLGATCGILAVYCTLRAIRG